ncbi:hypothetical protein [Gracilibacillus phocaeensis]|uniref:hypothetical protein n=1 Tax=Gracilibacillus phocaeensis TaxID=2042304 RepID=UPI0013EF4494|nr:hypothetical protein [Gracilibacillus phocaeensis]
MREMIIIIFGSITLFVMLCLTNLMVNQPIDMEENLFFSVCTFSIYRLIFWGFRRNKNAAN